MKTGTQIEMKRPSHLADLGGVLIALHQGEADRYDELLGRLPEQVSHLLRTRGVQKAATDEIVEHLGAVLRVARESSLALVAQGGAFIRIADTIDMNLKAVAARSAPPASPSGFVITGV